LDATHEHDQPVHFPCAPTARCNPRSPCSGGAQADRYATGGGSDDTTFTEDAVDWKVLAPLWSEAEKVVLVRYYDEAAAAAARVNEDFMRTFAAAVSCGVEDPGPCPSPLERSSVMEIREWICAFQGA
jgi:hypothetical protein